ncbi:MAG: ABC transporter substrate-binding protein [Ilumatobacter sp.]|nr:MAG: ABC transporter substrate-binding protein [Ilumatobacter sp.]
MRIDGPPARIVSLVPSLSETLVSWGLASRLVGVTDWCISPPGAFDHATRVRGTKNPDVAAIVALAPDLVVANEEENRRADVERLRAEGVAVWVTAPRSLTGVAASFERLGPVLGVDRAASRLAAEIRGAVAGASVHRRSLRTFCPVWRDPWIAVGTDTIAADLLRCAGFTVVPELARYPRVELDDVAELDPDVVLLPDEPYEFGPDDHGEFAGWRAQVRDIDGATLTWWGPRTPAALTTFAALARSL